MNSARPPRLAAWILQHFGPELNREALSGDLNEAFQQGRSKAWYWRQVLAAVRWRRVIYTLMASAVAGWYMSPRHTTDNRPLHMTVITVIVLAGFYLPGMLRGVQRVLLALLIVAGFVLFYQLTPGLADHYWLSLWVASNLVFSKKRLTHPPYHLTRRELLLGDHIAERQRMIARLEQTMMEETDPGLRQAYAESIAALRRHLPPGTKVVE